MKDLPEKVWLILGHHPATRIKELPYSTDPREYGLPGLKPMSDEEYAAVSNRVKAFQSADDAIDFCYECGLMITFIHGFRLIDGKYQPDAAVTREVSDTAW
jgi:hypothetical protein